MYEQKQIIIDGEILGNDVVINRYFELIYNISPLIIKNFINIINETSCLSKPVRIKKYDFTQNNCINIYFRNRVSAGEIKLAYILNKNNELLVDTYNLLITEGENTGFSKFKQNIKAKLNLDEMARKQFNICQLDEEFVEISSNNLKDINSELDEVSQVDDENLEQEIEKNIDACIEELEEDSEEIQGDKLLEEQEEEINVEEKEKDVLLEEIISEEEMIEARKAIFNENINKELQEVVETETNDILEQKTEIDEFSMQESQDVVANENVSKQDISLDAVKSETSINEQEKVNFDDCVESKADENNDLVTSSLDGLENENYVEEQEKTNFDAEENNNKIDLGINIDAEENEKSLSESEENLLEIAEMINKVEELNNICEKFNGCDFVDFYDTIPKFSEDYLETVIKDETVVDEINDEDKEEDILSQNYDIKDLINKKIRKKYKLNRSEKIAMYQNILQGYDNKMTESKLNKFKEKFNSIQKDGTLTTEDVLDAQVELLVDNKSKAFRILSGDEKQDVIKIDDELFLSKDKIYTWGDVYLLE